MTELTAQQVEPNAPAGLTQMERLVDTFVAPTKTFEDIRRSASWWLPFLVALVLGMAFSFTVTQKVGYSRLADGVISQSPALQDRMNSGTPAEAAQIHATIEKQFQYTIYLYPVIAIVIGLICAGVLLATVNFGMGGEAKFGQMLAVWFYATLPLSLIGILTILSLYAGMAPEQFNLQNPIGTNIGYYLSSDTPKWLTGLLDSVDVISIWSACLLTIGVAVVGKVKRSSAAIAVFGWWILYVLVFKVALVALRG
ncbi:MAG: YIP1 family protein [Acidobacteriaceae bacterium]